MLAPDNKIGGLSAADSKTYGTGWLMVAADSTHFDLLREQSVIVDAHAHRIHLIAGMNRVESDAIALLPDDGVIVDFDHHIAFRHRRYGQLAGADFLDRTVGGHRLTRIAV